MNTIRKLFCISRNYDLYSNENQKVIDLLLDNCIAVVTNDSRNDYNIANNDSGIDGKYIFKGNKSFKGYFIVIK